MISRHTTSGAFQRLDFAFPPSVPVNAAASVFVTRLDRDPQEAGRLYGLLSSQERDRAERFHFERDRLRYTVAHGWLREILAAHLDAEAVSLEFSCNRFGKPALGGHFASSGLTFNLSHCEDLAVLGVCQGRRIGIDTEALRNLDAADDVAFQFFSRQEHAAYLSVAPNMRPQAFFNCWTRKEAIIKAIGEGLSRPLDTFDVTLLEGEPARLLRIDELSGEQCGWDLESFCPATGFVGAVAVERKSLS